GGELDNDALALGPPNLLLRSRRHPPDAVRSIDNRVTDTGTLKSRPILRSDHASLVHPSRSASAPPALTSSRRPGRRSSPRGPSRPHAARTRPERPRRAT